MWWCIVSWWEARNSLSVLLWLLHKQIHIVPQLKQQLIDFWYPSEMNNGHVKSYMFVKGGFRVVLFFIALYLYAFFVLFCSVLFLQCFPSIVNSTLIFMCGRHRMWPMPTELTGQLQSVQFVFFTMCCYHVTAASEKPLLLSLLFC